VRYDDRPNVTMPSFATTNGNTKIGLIASLARGRPLGD